VTEIKEFASCACTRNNTETQISYLTQSLIAASSYLSVTCMVRMKQVTNQFTLSLNGKELYRSVALDTYKSLRLAAKQILQIPVISAIRN